jgi:exosome complex component RRP40
MLQTGDLVYARVSVASDYLDAVELECVSATTGKSDGLGPLKDGMIFDVSLGMARRLMLGKKAGCVVLEVLGERIDFEAAVGRNGRVWISAGEIKLVVAVGRALQGTDKLNLDEKAQKKLVDKLLREL